MSEIVSQIIEPISYEQAVYEADSTDDMLSKIDNLTKQIVSGEIEYCAKVEAHEPMMECSSKFITETPLSPQSCRIKFDRGDIRNFGKIGSKTNDANNEANKARIKDAIKNFKNKLVNGSVISLHF